jgi:large conductance mechanosensitive channel
VGFIVGNAFSDVVKSLVDDIITPPLGLLIGGVDFVNLTITMTNFVYQNKPPVVIRYGRFIQTVLFLLIIALVLFCLIKGITAVYRTARKKKNADVQPDIALSTPTEEIQILRDIRDLLARRSMSNAAQAYTMEKNE